MAPSRINSSSARNGTNVSEVHLFLLTISEPSHAFSFHERRALVDDVTKHAGRVAEQGDRFAGIVERFEQSDRNRALREIPHGAVPAKIEDRIVIFRFQVGELDRLG